jgi:uncharacterized membrane protein YeaQ/YmgE (transglycosylase-associated protein family)
LRAASCSRRSSRRYDPWGAGRRKRDAFFADGAAFDVKGEAAAAPKARAARIELSPVVSPGADFFGRLSMSLMGLIIWLLIGAIAGWLAGNIMKGGGFGVVGNILVGIIGAAIAGAILPRIGLYIGGGLLGDIINAVIGACILLFIIGLIKR